jgi:nucleotide-binding universal stress UspA family protein
MNTLEEAPSIRKQRGKSSLEIRKIVAAVDLSQHSKKTAAYAAALAQRFGASLTLVHAFEPEGTTRLATDRVCTSLEEAWREAERGLSKLVEEIREKYPSCEMEFRIGNPVEQISLTASILGADLVVAASRHPVFLARLFGVDQAPKILRSLNCPVLIYQEAATKTAAAEQRQGAACPEQPTVS